MADNVNHPKHYTAHPSGVEAVTICEHFSFNVGNAIKLLVAGRIEGRRAGRFEEERLVRPARD
jgi:hypothetical protein